MNLKQLALIFLEITGINGIFRRRNNQAIILWYHGVCDDDFTMLKGYDERHVPKSLFRKQLLFLIKKGCRFATMSELVKLLKEKKDIAKTVVLTFDDGFRNVVENAYPIMKELNAKGCVYLISNLVSGQNLLWTDLIEMVLRNRRPQNFEFRFKGETLTYALGTKESCEKAIRNIKDRLRSISDSERKKHLEQFEAQARDMKNVPKEFLMAGWEQIQGLEKNILEAGSHTRNHPNCANLTVEKEFESELKGSKDDIEQQLGYPIESFCYPAGSYNDKVIGYVKKYGYTSATSIIPGFNDPQTSLFELKRICVDENFWAFKAMVSGSFFCISGALQRIKGKK